MSDHPLTRYRLCFDANKFSGRMEPEPTGNWVQFAEVEPLLRERDDLLQMHNTASVLAYNLERRAVIAEAERDQYKAAWEQLGDEELTAARAALKARQNSACINCGEADDGGYLSGFEGDVNEGAVGPFCSQCWEFLRETFSDRAARPAEER